jgi:hypothetical protein
MNTSTGLTDDQFLERLKSSRGGYVVTIGTPEWNIAARLERRGEIELTTRPGGKEAIATSTQKVYGQPQYIHKKADGVFAGVFASKPAEPIPAERQDIVNAIRGLAGTCDGYLIYPLLAGLILDVIGEARFRPGVDRAAALVDLMDTLETIYEQWG